MEKQIKIKPCMQYYHEMSQYFTGKGWLLYFKSLKKIAGMQEFKIKVFLEDTSLGVVLV